MTCPNRAKTRTRPERTGLTRAKPSARPARRAGTGARSQKGSYLSRGSVWLALIDWLASGGGSGWGAHAPPPRGGFPSVCLSGEDTYRWFRRRRGCGVVGFGRHLSRLPKSEMCVLGPNSISFEPHPCLFWAPTWPQIFLGCYEFFLCFGGIV